MTAGVNELYIFVLNSSIRHDLLDSVDALKNCAIFIVLGSGR